MFGGSQEKDQKPKEPRRWPVFSEERREATEEILRRCEIRSKDEEKTQISWSIGKTVRKITSKITKRIISKLIYARIFVIVPGKVVIFSLSFYLSILKYT